ncbi:putative enoyl-CoA hydratase [Sphingobium herbicidovorans NBRC 16415]|uniref:Enoyl-CoA hydratase n=1 Tax=Sphingobium herbicidovorans (strain ATCC 700291 / DSM 11019 / CCUG 56400 / KCTC 2939 / LMG 18315 / NBRC 16415 / MH) TaxID=1219045 RepID=A0A086P4K8_SPHHM|nr:enoyl-CoA hydratase-related protein [Sphingobium herbicidovorans]KFG88326.1 putative enoyl-CoA hydratase [Sphingobium herbicidovorans NBRC 16415]
MSILTQVEQGVATLTLNRPDRLNAVTEAMLDEVVLTLRGWSVDPAVRCVVLAGAGRGFCAGYDLSGDEKAARAEPMRVDEAAARMSIHAEIPLLLHRMPKPTIACIRGPAAGSGLVMAAACDLRIASRTVKFKLAFASAGRCGDPGGSYLLTRLLGAARAREMFLLDEPMTGDQALGSGLINRLVDDDRLEAECAALAAKLANGPTAAFAAMKRNLNAAAVSALEESMAQEAASNAQISLLSHDASEAAKAFMERRTPRFLGY